MAPNIKWILKQPVKTQSESQAKESQPSSQVQMTKDHLTRSVPTNRGMKTWVVSQLGLAQGQVDPGPVPD